MKDLYEAQSQMLDTYRKTFGYIQKQPWFKEHEADVKRYIEAVTYSHNKEIDMSR